MITKIATLKVETEKLPVQPGLVGDAMSHNAIIHYVNNQLTKLTGKTEAIQS